MEFTIRDVGAASVDIQSTGLTEEDKLALANKQIANAKGGNSGKSYQQLQAEHEQLLPKGLTDQDRINLELASLAAEDVLTEAEEHEVCCRCTVSCTPITHIAARL